MPSSSSDRIQKQIELRAPLARVWKAITDPLEFGKWFGVNIDGAFKPGARVRGKITHPGYDHLTMEIVIEKIEPERLFSYRWHPYAIDPKVDYSKEPTTLVEFRLEAVQDRTRVTIVESGFDQIPPHRRDEAFRMNDGGCAQQTKNLERHVTPS